MSGTHRDDEPASLAARIPGPEVLAVLVAIVLVATVGSIALAGRPPGGALGPRPTPAPTTRASPGPQPLVDNATVEFVRVINQRLLTGGDDLARDLQRDPLSVAAVSADLRRVAANALFGASIGSELAAVGGEAEPGGRLLAVYAGVRAAAGQALDAAVTNRAAYRRGGEAILELLAQLPELQAELEVLARTPASGPLPAPSAAGDPASPPPSPSGSAVPSVAPSGSPLAAGEQIVDGSFEAGVRPPWELSIASGSRARVAADTTQPGEGTTSARIAIDATSEAFAGIAFRQTGLDIDAGATYEVRFLVRAEAPREVRLRIVAPAGAAYLTRTVTARTGWSEATIAFTAPASDPAAVIEFDLGRSDASVWLDRVSFRPTGRP